MFENIIGQVGVVETLRRELAGGSFPQAVLFHGPPYAGKLSAALETARVLSCEEGSGEWTCPCRSCASQRLLAYPYTLLLGSRYFDLEIAVSADVLRRTRRPAAQYLFLRAVRKLTRRFDPVLWEGEENRIKGLIPVLGEVEERLEALAPGFALPEERELEKEAERIGALCQKISSFLSEDNIPINQIRRAVYWMHLSSTGRRKVVIMENADRMYDASRNSLLKILEEPPETATLILLAANRGAILPTIRSRLRTYEFAERSPQEVGLVLKKIFQDETAEYAGMGEYFLAWREINPRVVSELARRFAGLLLRREEQAGTRASMPIAPPPAIHGSGGTRASMPIAPALPASLPRAGTRTSLSIDILEEMKPLLSTRSDRNSVSFFLEELIRVFHIMLRERALSSRTLTSWSKITQNKHAELTRYNLNPSLVLESLFYRLREVEIEKVLPEGAG